MTPETPVDPRWASLESMIAELRERAPDWVRVGTRERALLLDACRAGVLDVASDWARVMCEHQGVAPDSPDAGQAWLGGPLVTCRTLRTMSESLKNGGSQRPRELRERAGQWIARVMPADLLESLVYLGYEAEVWMDPGIPASQGQIYRAKERGEPGQGGVALVLGAGNISSIAPRDLLHKLCIDDEVVLLKLHEVNGYLEPQLRQAFAPLIDAGFLRIVQGDATVGEFLCRHPGIDSIHLTGSDRTYDAIVWGSTAQERDRRRATGEPVVTKPVTAELGCVTPVIVVPGDWSEADLDFQARSVAGMVTHNASFNCTAAKALLLARSWPQRERFLDRLRTALARTPQRQAYYPGAESRYRDFLERYPQAEALGPDAPPGALPWTLIPGVAPEAGEYALRNEAFCGVLAVVEIDAEGAAGFLERAIDVANGRIWGSLSCSLIVDDRTASGLGDRLEDAIARLRYGGVAVNCWSSMLYGLGTSSWGAFPGNRPERVESGIGWVGNALMFDAPQKSVARAPFRPWIKPLWFADHRTLLRLAELATEMEGRPRWSLLPRLVAVAARA